MSASPCAVRRGRSSFSNSQAKEHRRPRHRGRQHRRDRGRGVNGSRARSSATGSRRSLPGSSARARSRTPRRSARRSRSSSPSTSSRRTSGSASPTSASPSARCACRRSRTRDELETAIRFQAQDHIPMPLDQAVLDWEVDRPHDERERRAAGRRRRRRGAPRHDQPLLEARRDGGPAAGRHRPLRLRDDPRPAGGGPRRGRRGRVRRRPTVSYEERVAAAGRGRRARAPTTPETQPSTGAALLQPRRRHQPRGRAGQLLPLHPDLAVRDRGHRAEARRAPPARRSSTRASGSSTSASSSPVEEIEGDPETVARRPRGARRGRRQARRRAAALARVLRRPGGRRRGRGRSSPAVPGTTIPGLVERLQRDLGHPFSVGRPGRARRSSTRRRPPA